MPSYRSVVRTDTITAKRQVIDMSQTIAMLNASENPFTLILKKMSKKVCTNFKFEWMQDYLRSQVTTSPGAILAGDTTLTLASVAHIKVNDVIRAVGPASENFNLSDLMLVTAVDDALGTVDVVREISALNAEGGQAATGMTAGSSIIVIGNAFEEGSLSAVLLHNQENAFYNYVQNFKTAFGVTGRAGATKVVDGKMLDWERKKKGIEHARDMELAFLFGERSKIAGPVSGNYITTTAGLWQQITGVSYGGVATPGTLEEAEWDAYVEALFADNIDEGNRTKTVFGGSLIASALTGWAKPYLQIPPSTTTFGLTITQYKTPFGIVNFIYHPTVFDLTPYQYTAIGVDFRSLTYRFMEGRDTKLKTNIQENDRDGQKDEYETDAGLQVTTPEVNRKLIVNVV